jgi:hypothetical protein
VVTIIRLVTWPISGRNLANDWLEKGVEAIFDESFCHIMRSVIIAHPFHGSIKNGHGAYAGTRRLLDCRKRLLERLLSLPGNMALPPHMLASRQKTERKRRVIFRAKEENDVTPDYEAEIIL